jgi:hypothetical protein
LLFLLPFSGLVKQSSGIGAALITIVMVTVSKIAANGISGRCDALIFPCVDIISDLVTIGFHIHADARSVSINLSQPLL